MSTKKSLVERIIINLKGGHEAHVQKLVDLQEKHYKNQIKMQNQFIEAANKKIADLEESFKERFADKLTSIQEYIDTVDENKIKTHDDRAIYVLERTNVLHNMYKDLDSFQDENDKEIRLIKETIASQEKSINSYQRLLDSLELN